MDWHVQLVPMKAFLGLIVLCALTIPAVATPAQVIILRHGEKPKNHEAQHLSEAGRERARRLVDFVTSNPELTKFGPPVALFATHETKSGHGQRPSETIKPLAKKLKLPIETPYQSDHPDQLASSILASKEFDGKTVLICWTHEYIPRLIESLGIAHPPEKMPDDVYDRVYLVRYDAAHASLETLSQEMASAAVHGKNKVRPPKKLLKN